ncbi:hypothetical protein EG68_07572 [Paragonimus skrjabini miyazakii]|uniref:SHSP domain-containing protein n=1 Tax=Paragonimus skrjabini miyazakii TaxID=59628 RepID=A0A8S9YK92_9TREM|nr:hypothetical protein EG68_07572 [Paragonimus skrjabini miyazakii]
MTGKEKERVIPITTDARTLEQRRKDMVNNLERKQKGASGNLAKVDGKPPCYHNWDDEVNRWIQEAYNRWNEDMGRVTRNTFVLVPQCDFDMEPLAPFGTFEGFDYKPSILARMKQQLDSLHRQMNAQPHLRSGDALGAITPYPPNGVLDFLKDAYEIGDDGQLHFKVRFDVRGFGPNDIEVSTAKNRLTVHGKKSTCTDKSSSSSEFSRTIYLPDSIDDSQFQCHMTGDGILMVEAPVKAPDYQSLTFDDKRQLAIKPQAGTDVAKGATNKGSQLALQLTGVYGPSVLQDGETGRKLHVEIPVEPGFTSDDLRVRMDANCVVVSGKKNIVEGSGQSQCSHVKEFTRTYTIPETVDTFSVKTQLKDNTLIVEAPLLQSSA